jgi:transcription termination/antitermination protein NusG
MPEKRVYSVGDALRVVAGPFADFLGTVESIDVEDGRLLVMVEMFGRRTPVLLDPQDVEKDL